MAMDAEALMKMDDDSLRKQTLTGLAGRANFEAGVAEMNMRCASRVSKAADEMATAYRDLVNTTQQVLQAHHNIVSETRNLVRATWGIVVITVVTQAALILSELWRR